MADSANQHYVPQFYFRGFSLDGRSICVLNRGNGKTIPVASIRGQASKKYFYGDAEVEKALQKIDGAFSRVVNRLRDCPTFDNFAAGEYHVLLQNIMLQKARTMSARKRSRGMQDRLLQLCLTTEAYNNESLDERTREERIRSATTAEADPVQYQAMQMSIALELADSLFDLLPVMLENKTNRPFIFGDAPVVFSNPYLRRDRLAGVLGTSSTGLMVLYPLSPTRQLALLDDSVYKVRCRLPDVLPVRDLRDVSTLNRMQIHNAASAVYFHHRSFSPYVVSLWLQEHRLLEENRGAVVEAPGVDQRGEPVGDIFHCFEKQLPLIPRLSFLKYSQIPQHSEYPFSRRDAR